jgi:molecular chaperone HtpG
MTVKEQSETRAFEAEVKQVLDLMVHSLYSNKEIFLRELISNASDACDKLRFAALSNDSLYGDDPELRVEVEFDKKLRTVSVRDNGIGMNRDEVIENIGTIARSGTRKFIEAMSGDQKQDSQLIGQFGVGFYASFIVADGITLITRSAEAAEDEAVRWYSDGSGEYTIEQVSEPKRGTTVILHLKDDEDEFLEEYRLQSLIRGYSDHIGFPVKMEKTITEEEGEGDDKKEVERTEWEVVNQASALWTLPKSEISDEEYQAFYQHVSHDFNAPLTWSHNRVEGNQAFTTLLFLPEKAPFDLMVGREDRHGLKLYIRRVFIMDAAEQLLPTYLRFVRGVVDSDDLPLNVSREILQENQLVSKIKASVVKRVLDMIEKQAGDDENYPAFWNQFGEVLKEGPVEDIKNREKLLKLMRFASTEGDGDKQIVSLADYVSRMKGAQDKIYYITADSYQAASNSPHLEVFRKQGIEVLVMYDRVDEWMMGHLQDFDGKPFQSVAKGDIDLSNLEDESEKEARKESEEQAKDLIERLGKALEEKVADVRVSHRLTDSPSCLVLDEHDMAMHMQALLKQAGHEMPGSKPHLEINPEHDLVKRLAGEGDESSFNDWAMLLFEQAWLAEGGQLDDPAGFVRRLNGLLLAVSNGSEQG